MTTPPIYVEAPLPHEHNTNNFLIKETRAELLACTTWQEVEAIIGNLTEDAKGTVWATFTTEQKRAFKGMKIRFAHSIELRDNVSSDANSNSVRNSESNALSQQDALDFGQELSLICN